MELKIGTESEKNVWDELVGNSIQGTIFHTWDWLKIMNKYSLKKLFFNVSSNSTLYPLFVFDGSELIGAMPIYYYRSSAFKIVSSPPFSVEDYYLGYILKDGALKLSKRQARLMQFQQAINNFIKNELKPNFILIHTAPGSHDTRPFKWSGYEVEPMYTYMLDLKGGKEKIWNNFSKSLRREIDIARKGGIYVEEGGKKELKIIYDLLLGRDRIHSRVDFLIEIFDRFYPKNLRVFIAKKNDECLSGIITICYKNKVSFWIGSPRCSYQGINPNELVFWESIKWACDNGFDSYEIMGADDETLYPFKSKFNGELIPYFTMRWTSPMFKLFESVYRIMKPRYKG